MNPIIDLDRPVPARPLTWRRFGCAVLAMFIGTGIAASTASAAPATAHPISYYVTNACSGIPASQITHYVHSLTVPGAPKVHYELTDISPGLPMPHVGSHYCAYTINDAILNTFVIPGSQAKEWSTKPVKAEPTLGAHAVCDGPGTLPALGDGMYDGAAAFYTVIVGVGASDLVVEGAKETLPEALTTGCNVLVPVAKMFLPHIA